jgi:toxin YoeB
MKRDICFEPSAWEDYTHWQKTDKAILKRINALITEAVRTPFEGTGKPEALRFDLAGYWSRRITQEHRLVYKVTDSEIIIVQCRLHY